MCLEIKSPVTETEKFQLVIITREAASADCCVQSHMSCLGTVGLVVWVTCGSCIFFVQKSQLRNMQLARLQGKLQ